MLWRVFQYLADSFYRGGLAYVIDQRQKLSQGFNSHLQLDLCILRMNRFLFTNNSLLRESAS